MVMDISVVVTHRQITIQCTGVAKPGGLGMHSQLPQFGERSR